MIKPAKHSDEMEDLITAPPSWMLRWGVTVFLLLLVIAGGLSYYIRYPDVVPATVAIYSTDSSAPVAFRATGTMRLLVKDHQDVQQGQPLAYIENSSPGQTRYDSTGSTSILRAPHAGQVAMIGLPINGQAVQAGQALCYIRQSATATFYGKLFIPQKEISQVAKGHIVLIKLERYAGEDFGVIRGTIDAIGELPDEHGLFVASVRLEQPETARVTLKEGLRGDAEIVLRDRSLLDRVRAKFSV